MNLSTWLAVALVCALGAMSPGPSLAVVLRHTLTGGRGPGSLAAITHALGIGLYALLCVSGLAFVVTKLPWLYLGLQWAGALYLAWLGWQGLNARERPQDAPAPPVASAARDGFLIVFLNPKVAVFFIALFSQVIGPGTPLVARLGYAATAMLIDAGWYLLVAWGFSNPRWLGWLKARSVILERCFGVVLLLLAFRLAWQSFAG